MSIFNNDSHDNRERVRRPTLLFLTAEVEKHQCYLSEIVQTDIDISTGASSRKVIAKEIKQAKDVFCDKSQELSGALIKQGSMHEANDVNPLVPSAHKSVRISKISILKLEEIIKKISYERCDYESVDEKGLS